MKTVITHWQAVVVVAAATLLMIASYWWAYKYPVDRAYITDLYYHSQWGIAANVRSIGDDGLYQVAAIKTLESNGNAYIINPEVPPFGKYLHALTLLLTNRTTVINIPLFIIASLSTYLLALKILTNKKYALIALALFISQPLVITQLPLTMQDLLQTTLLIIHIYAFLKISTSSYKNVYALTAGATLGYFAATKFGIYALPIIIIEALYAYKAKLIRQYLYLILATISAYFSMVVPFLISGHSVKEFTDIHKYTFRFYLDSKAPRDPLAVLTALFLPYYKQWWSTSWEFVSTWSVLWPIAIITSLYYAFKTKQTEIQFLTTIILGLIVVNLFVPFWIRYMLILIPFLIIILTHYLQSTPFLATKKGKFITYILSIIFLAHALYTLLPQPAPLITDIKKSIETNTYQDLYQSFDTLSKQHLNRDTLWRQMLRAQKNAHIQSTIVQVPQIKVYPWQSTATVEAQVTHITEIGTLRFHTKVQLIKEDNQWKYIFAADNYLPYYELEDEVQSSIQTAKFGRIITNTGQILAQEATLPYIQVKPEAVDQSAENNMIQLLSQATNEKRYIVEGKYKANVPYDWYADVGFAAPDHNSDIIDQLSKLPGIRIQARQGIIFNEVAKESDISAELYKIIEENEDKLMPRYGGTISIRKKDGKTIELLKTEPENGKDVLYAEKR